MSSGIYSMASRTLTTVSLCLVHAHRQYLHGSTFTVYAHNTTKHFVVVQCTIITLLIYVMDAGDVEKMREVQHHVDLATWTCDLWGDWSADSVPLGEESVVNQQDMPMWIFNGPTSTIRSDWWGLLLIFWLCHKCTYVRDGSFFSKPHSTLQKWVILMYWWARNYRVRNAAHEAEVTEVHVQCISGWGKCAVLICCRRPSGCVDLLQLSKQMKAWWTKG